MVKSVRLQTEYLETRRRRITVHSVPVNINEDWMRAIFTKYGQVDVVSALISKSGNVTGDTVLQGTMTRQSFVLMYQMMLWWKATAPLLVMWCLGAQVKGVLWEEYNNTATTDNITNGSSSSSNKD